LATPNTGAIGVAALGSVFLSRGIAIQLIETDQHFSGDAGAIFG
jgi:hypothetical protein